MTQESFITTELALVKEGLGGCCHQQAMCILAKNAQLATIVSEGRGIKAALRKFRVVEYTCLDST